MSDPTFTFDKEEFTLTVGNLGAGWSLGRLGELRLLDEAQLQFPQSWSEFQTGVAVQVVQAQWPLTSRLVLTQTLEAGVDYSGADGAGSSFSLDNELLLHIMDRPATQIDLRMNIMLDGRYNSGGFEGSGTVNVGLKVRF